MGTFRRTLGYYRPYLPSLSLIAVLVLITAQADVLLALFVKPLFDEVFINKNMGFLFIIPIFAVSLVIGKGVFQYLYRMFLVRITLRVTQGLRAEMFNHYLNLPLGYYHDTSIGEIMNKVTIEINAFQTSLNIIFSVLSQMLLFIALVGVIFYRDWKLAILSICVVPLSMLPMTIIGRLIKKYAKKAFEALGQIAINIQETIAGIRIIKAFHLESRRLAGFRKTNLNYYNISRRSMRLNILTSPSMELIVALGISIILYYGGLQVIRGQLTPGSLFSFFTAVGLIYEPVRSIAKQNNQLQVALGSAERVFEILDMHVAITDKPDAVDIPEIQECIEFQDIHMSYGTEEVIKGVSFKISKGEVVALVGPSGSGKTTLANLIPRFYDVNSGELKIDGINVKDATLKSLRFQIGVVTQDTFLFHDSIRDNIAYGLERKVSDEEVERAARDANANLFIKEMEEGYDTLVGERGIKLSGGERQRIAIARALLKNAPILILDEATSSLDSESELLVQKALYKLMENRTVLVIAHRLSTVRRADRILVIEQGRIVEQGTHEKLMEKAGLYKRLYEMQYFEAEDSAA